MGSVFGLGEFLEEGNLEIFKREEGKMAEDVDYIFVSMRKP